jgi:hypothetical protein
VEQLVFIHINSRALKKMVRTQECVEEIESHIIQAEDDLIAKCRRGNTILGKRGRDDGEDV